MGLLTTYFSAALDADAAKTIDWPGGPESGGPTRLFRRREPGHPSVDGYGIEPVVELGQLEELLTGKSFDAQLADPASRPLVAVRNQGEGLVIRIGDDFVQALASCDSEQIAGVVDAWAAIEEFHGRREPDALHERAVALSELARSARARGHHLYCWLSV